MSKPVPSARANMIDPCSHLSTMLQHRHHIGGRTVAERVRNNIAMSQALVDTLRAALDWEVRKLCLFQEIVDKEKQ